MGTNYIGDTMPKTRINISTDQDLADFIKVFAAENRTTVAEIFNQYIISIKKKVENEYAEPILSNPIFKEAMIDAQNKLQNGAANWYSYTDLFDD